MIDLFLNEKSLEGQYASLDDFCENGILSLISVIKDSKRLTSPTTLYKSYNLSEAKVTSSQNYFEIIFGEEGRIHDVIRRYKVELSTTVENPYWNEDIKQKSNDKYMSINGMSLNGTSIAEAEARDGILVSFAHSSYSIGPLLIKKNDNDTYVSNVWQEQQLLDVTYHKSLIQFKEYVTLKFDGQKLDFSKATMDKVWDRIPVEVEGLVYDAFETFCKESWIEIPQDKGLGYKSYSKTGKNSRFFQPEYWDKGIKEFRFSGKYRCFGYVERGTFYLLLIDLGHVLGDSI